MRKLTNIACCTLLILYISMQWLIGFRPYYFTNYEWYTIDQLSTCFLFVVCVFLFPNWYKVPAFFMLSLACIELFDQIVYKNIEVHLSDYLTVGASFLATIGFVFIRHIAKRLK